MSDEDAISLSDAESEGEGPNIRPPQAAGSSHSHGGKKHHKQKYRDRDMWRQRHRDERDGGKRDRDGRRKGDGRRDDRRDRDRERVSGGGRRISDNTQDLRHRLKEKHSRDSGHEDRPRSDKRYSHESRSRSDRDHHSTQKANRFVEADKHKEKSRREVEEARRQRELLEVIHLLIIIVGIFLMMKKIMHHQMISMIISYTLTDNLQSRVLIMLKLMSVSD